MQFQTEPPQQKLLLPPIHTLLRPQNHSSSPLKPHPIPPQQKAEKRQKVSKKVQKPLRLSKYNLLKKGLNISRPVDVRNERICEWIDSLMFPWNYSPEE